MLYFTRKCYTVKFEISLTSGHTQFVSRYVPETALTRIRLSRLFSEIDKLQLTQIWTRMVSGTGRQTKRVCPLVKLISNSTVKGVLQIQ